MNARVRAQFKYLKKKKKKCSFWSEGADSKKTATTTQMSATCWTGAANYNISFASQ